MVSPMINPLPLSLEIPKSLSVKEVLISVIVVVIPVTPPYAIVKTSPN